MAQLTEMETRTVLERYAELDGLRELAITQLKSELYYSAQTTLNKMITLFESKIEGKV